MNNTDPKVFGEYGTKNAAGQDITPASNVIASYGGNIETILSATQAAAYDYDKMFTNWDPKALATQLTVTGVNLSAGILSWDASQGATAYAVLPTASCWTSLLPPVSLSMAKPRPTLSELPMLWEA